MPDKRRGPDIVTYEQCPWNRSHVEALYEVLARNVAADGDWHDFPPLPVDLGWYRVYGNRHFQAIYAKWRSPIVERLLTMPALDIKATRNGR